MLLPRHPLISRSRSGGPWQVSLQAGAHGSPGQAVRGRVPRLSPQLWLCPPSPVSPWAGCRRVTPHQVAVVPAVPALHLPAADPLWEGPTPWRVLKHPFWYVFPKGTDLYSLARGSGMWGRRGGSWVRPHHQQWYGAPSAAEGPSHPPPTCSPGLDVTMGSSGRKRFGVNLALGASEPGCSAA